MKRFVIPLAGLAFLAACADEEVLLEGERFDVAGLDNAAVVNRADPLNLPAAALNADWTHIGGNQQHQRGSSGARGNECCAPTRVGSSGAMPGPAVVRRRTSEA